MYKYRIKKRKYSSNIIERGTPKDDGSIKWEPYIAPLVSKKEGDHVCYEIFEDVVNNKNLV